jgi:HEPN domain-containing protein
LRRLWDIISSQFTEDLDLDMLRELTDVYTDCRYPDNLGLLPSGIPTKEDAARFEHFADYVHSIVLAMLS